MWWQLLVPADYFLFSNLCALPSCIVKMFLLPQFINTDSIKHHSTYLVWKLGLFILCSHLCPSDCLPQRTLSCSLCAHQCSHAVVWLSLPLCPACCSSGLGAEAWGIFHGMAFWSSWVCSVGPQPFSAPRARETVVRRKGQLIHAGVGVLWE